MVVVADTSPLNYLILSEAIQILQKLYARICVPEAVIAELRSSNAPLLVQQWAASTPPWVEVHAVTNDFLATHGGKGCIAESKRR